jgi:oxygen-dependent protoporphyrinogen oxidase
MSVDVVVIGGGVSGLTTAWRLAERAPDLKIAVLEAAEVAGGTATSGVGDGFTFDRGPNGFLTSNPSTWQLAHDLGIGQALVEAAPEAKRRYLLLDRGLEALPHAPPSLLGTPLLSARGKLRAAREPFVPTGTADDESVFAFFERRFGSEVATTFAAPMVMGITSGDARATSVRSVFPTLVRAEQEFGSVIKGMMALRKQRAPDAPSGRLTSLRGGMGVLTSALASALGARVQLGHCVESLEPTASGWSVGGTASSGPFRIHARQVVTTLPARRTAQLLRPLSELAATVAERIPYAGVRVLAMGFQRSQVRHPLDGFGFLVPRGGRARILGCVWPSTVFPGRAPEGHVLLRVIAGGTLDPEFVGLSEDAALTAALDDLREPLGIEGAPGFVRHVRWPEAIPQADVGHERRVAELDRALERYPGLHVSGNAFRGISVNDCVAYAATLAERIETQARAG